MKSNLGNLDKAARIAAAVIIVALYYMAIISGTVAILLLVLAAIFIITSFISFCPIYRLLGISSLKKQKPDANTHQK